MATSTQGVSRNGFWEALDERLGLSGLAYPVPAHANRLPYLLGGITLFGFIILIVTGLLLAQFYHPHPADAHDSVIYIITQAPFGDFIRSIHFWAANLVVITALLHLVRIFVTGSFKRPREFNWLVGLGLLGITFLFVFTGTVLKWDQEGVEALGHNKEIGELLGNFGTWFTGEFTRSVPLLTRLYFGHISVLPITLILLMVVHFYLINRLGISPQATPDAISGPTKGQGASRFTAHLRRLAGYGLLLWGLIGLLALLIPAPLGQPGVAGAEVTKPPWMFLPIYIFENWLGIKGILVGGGFLFILLALIPFIDRSPWLSPRKRRWIMIAGAILLVALIVFGMAAWLTVPAAHLMEP
ncbi:MAG: cytochrome b N-terminal domain-containing protein [Chloroflexi bacterium]|nr:cytochrome b N-terminal domain-containing protein [Chloroflexota bacterium]